MKQTIIPLILSIIFFACSKSRPTSPDAVTPSYLGIYDAPNKDTSYVTQNGGYISIGWANRNGNRRIYFDSTDINSDSTFSINQIVNDYLWVYERAIGTGRFYNNTLEYDIMVGTGRIRFYGIKRK